MMQIYYQHDTLYLQIKLQSNLLDVRGDARFRATLSPTRKLLTFMSSIPGLKMAQYTRLYILSLYIMNTAPRDEY